MPLTQVDAGLLNSTAQYTGFKNRIINGDFYIWQRGTSFSNPASGAFTYTSDRWGTFVSGTGSTATVSQQATTPGTFTSEPVEPAYFLRYAVTVAGSVTYRDFAQRIEDVLQTAGKTVTLSFYARASSTVSVTPYWYQNFGTGGSGDVSANGSAFNIGTSWTKYTTTLTIASAFGKTIGPPNTSWCAIGLILPNTTLQIDFALMQVELGSTATSFDYRPYGQELALCQRYYEKSFSIDTAPANGANTTSYSGTGMAQINAPHRNYLGSSYGGWAQVIFKVPKRSSASMIMYGNSNNGYLTSSGTTGASTWTGVGAAISLLSDNTTGFVVMNEFYSATNQFLILFHWTASAEL